MKFSSILFTGFLLLQFTLVAQEGWVQQLSGTSVDLNSVYFVNNDVGWAVGDSGIVLKTTSGGFSWIQQPAGIITDINAVYFIDVNTGWFVGGSINMGTSSRVIYNTVDGGTNWIFQLGGRGGILNSVQFVDQNIGWTAGLFGEILKTTNGGLDWDSLNSGISDDLYCIFFTNNNIGWTLGAYGTILKTVDGGESWLPKTVGTTMDLVSCTFIDENLGWIVGTDIVYPGQAVTSIYNTTNGGEDWLAQWGQRGWINSIYFKNDTCGWASGSLGWILCTTNQGLDWNAQMMIGTMQADLYSIFFSDNDYGWAVGENGTIIHTTDGGITFIEENEMSKIPTGYNLSQNFPNPFNPSTKIKYSIPQSLTVVIRVFDLLGNKLETLVNEEKPVGTYELTWNAVNLPSGVYFYQLSAGDFIQTKKMILLK